MFLRPSLSFYIIIYIYSCIYKSSASSFFQVLLKVDIYLSSLQRLILQTKCVLAFETKLDVVVDLTHTFPSQVRKLNLFLVLSLHHPQYENRSKTNIELLSTCQRGYLRDTCISFQRLKAKMENGDTN